MEDAHVMEAMIATPQDGTVSRGLTKRWRMRQPPQAQAPLVQRLLASRGLVDAGQIAGFLDPKLTNLHDPSLMPGIDQAATRLIDAIRRNELIAIYGDYDVDGIAATAILFHVIKAIQPTACVRTYVPHRLEEGYGLNGDALRQLKSEGAALVISVDCGIAAIGPAQTARDIGLDLIITDHHEIGTRHEASGTSAQCLMPDAVAVVHPALPGSNYPFADLCGAGVAFKLAWRLATAWCNSQRVSETLQKTLVSMVPLVALATVADVVPLVGENRILTAFGLRLLKGTPLIGLRALIEASDLMDEKIDSHKVGFVLGPRLNACGRMGHAAEAVRLLTEAPQDEAVQIASKLTLLNRDRQIVERRILDHATQMARDSGMTGDDCRAIVLADESWHPGVVGIVCSRLVDRFCRPVVLLQRQRDVCKGSARSIDGYSIHEGLCAARQFLTSYGGHAMAAGLSLATSHVEAFAQALIAHANQHIGADELIASISIDCDADVAELDLERVRQLSAMAPFGRGNRAPMIRLRNVTLSEAPKQMGANGKHLSLRLRQDVERERHWIRGVWWNAGERAVDLAAGMQLDVAIEPKLNDWNGRTSVEAEVHDVRVCEST